eukprot:6190358-Pleurochrysis_carterae.AAC.3
MRLTSVCCSSRKRWHACPPRLTATPGRACCAGAVSLTVRVDAACCLLCCRARSIIMRMRRATMHALPRQRI